MTTARKPGKVPVLVYLYPERLNWPGNDPGHQYGLPSQWNAHLHEILRFARQVEGDEVRL